MPPDLLPDDLLDDDRDAGVGQQAHLLKEATFHREVVGLEPRSVEGDRADLALTDLSPDRVKVIRLLRLP